MGKKLKRLRKNVQHIRATAGAFAAICADGTLKSSLGFRV